MKRQDETYWAGKLRQFAHVIDKGLSIGDFSKVHGNEGYRLAKEALSRIKTRKYLDDPIVRWAAEMISMYELFQGGRNDKIQSRYVSTICGYEYLIDAIKTRRSIRKFIKKPVEKEAIEKIASVLDWAPTSCHRQPGRVYASSNQDIVQKCVKLHNGGACFTNIYVPLFLTFCADTRLYEMPDEFAAPYIDVSLGIQNCLLTAHTLGISLVPLIWSKRGGLEEDVMRKMFSIPQYYQIILSAAGGYPAEGAAVPPRKKSELFIVNEDK